jgi:hypothetical protein
MRLWDPITLSMVVLRPDIRSQASSAMYSGSILSQLVPRIGSSASTNGTISCGVYLVAWINNHFMLIKSG